MTATVVDAPEVRGLGPVRDPVTQVAGAALLPFVYGTWWFGNVTRQLREFGSDGRDARLSVVSPAWAWSGMALGWILVVPAVVVMVGTARRVQHAEELASVGRQSIGGVIAAVVGGQALGIVAVVGGSAILAPFALLASAVLVVAMLQPRLNRIWKRSAGWPARDREPAPDAIPFVPPAWSRRWGGMAEDVREFLGFSLVAVALTCAAAAVSFLASFLAAEDRTGLLGGFVTALSLVALLVGVSFAVGSLLRLAAGGRFALDRAVVGAALLSAVAAVAWLWTVRPLFHGVLMSLYHRPLVTWLPLVAGLAFTTLLAAVGNARAGIAWRVPVTLLVWGVFMLLLPGWQAQALYAATAYVPTDLPRTTQPRLLPKVAALAFGSDARLHDAHLVVDPSSHRLVWSAERAGGWPRRGPSQRVVALPLDRVDGTIHDVADGFDRAVSRVGPASLQWRAYDRHFLTRVQDAVLVPGVDGEAVAVAPYVRYAGFPVRHPVWAGVYVYHQDGRMEDLTPEQALARPSSRTPGGCTRSGSPARSPMPIPGPRSTTRPATRSRTSPTWATTRSAGSRWGILPLTTTRPRRST
jgi:hypothetical protein